MLRQQADAVPLRAATGTCNSRCSAPLQDLLPNITPHTLWYSHSTCLHFFYVIAFLLVLSCLVGCVITSVVALLCVLPTLVRNIVGVFFLCLKSCFSIATCSICGLSFHQLVTFATASIMVVTVVVTTLCMPSPQQLLIQIINYSYCCSCVTIYIIFHDHIA